jgi:glycosyltransferase involved in cell wall biosynthesis
MPTDLLVSIVICTRNHGPSLHDTLESLGAVQVPEQMTAELIIADNGSTDDTAAVVAAATPRLKNMAGGVHTVVEPRAGQCYARNAGIAASRGDIILFTDDDLRFPTDWLDVCDPIRRGEADAVVGGVRLAPYLLRDWMVPYHRSWLASTEEIDPEEPRLVGANFAFSRRVLEKVPAFDTDLGPGRIGFGDDTLFGDQLRAAGFRIAVVRNIEVEHHCDADRLLRSSYLSTAQKMGRTLAYHEYHWNHSDTPAAGLRLLRLQAKLAARRLVHWRECHRTEGMPLWEMYDVKYCYFYRQWRIESRRPRLYDRHGLVKRIG